MNTPRKGHVYVSNSIAVVLLSEMNESDAGGLFRFFFFVFSWTTGPRYKHSFFFSFLYLFIFKFLKFIIRIPVVIGHQNTVEKDYFLNRIFNGEKDQKKDKLFSEMFLFSGRKAKIFSIQYTQQNFRIPITESWNKIFMHE